LRRIAAGLDDLKGRMHERNCRPHLVQRRRARERPVQLHAELGLEAWPDQLAGREDMASPPGLQNATEAGLVKSELLLDCLGGKAALPADLPLACRATAIDQRQLDAVRLVQTQPI